MTQNEALRVLIVDDDPKQRQLLKLTIKSLKLEVVGEGNNGAEAIELYRTLKPNMVFLDIDMPVKDGISTLKELMAEFPDANVIMVTSQDMRIIIDECLIAGAKDFIRKDASTYDIKERIISAIKEIKF
ncbi:response regulator transcription factor [Candidatus Magnetomonas plexicatena]|uniref:response regulator transcription factor n=1 Tax=Candidatus Magnetomonas plexicatena TaxID=2552947 RepID=UPI001C762677|nr:response regulator [Nitrospirales bacterium LBB_01]